MFLYKAPLRSVLSGHAFSAASEDLHDGIPGWLLMQAAAKALSNNSASMP